MLKASTEPETKPDRSNHWARAQFFIPNGTQTLSKCPSRFVDGVYPKFLKSGHGCSVEDLEGKLYTDYICGLGPILLGYNNNWVNKNVKDAILAGQVLLSLPHPKEITLAETLHNIFPHAKKSKFYKTGSDALSAAVKVARAYTGKYKVAVCGYHGWHDWYTIANDKKAGIPPVLEDYVVKFKYNNPQSLAECFKNNDIAAVVLEPVVYEEPKDNFLQKVREMAHENEALLVFDEVVTGFRFGLGGAAGHFNVVPDLACYSKAMGNGFPIAALVGFSEYMNVFERDDFFISGTFGGDLIGIAAALAVIQNLEWHSGEGGHKEGAAVRSIWRAGTQLKDGFNKISEFLDLPTRCIGYAPRTMFEFPTPAHKAYFWQECVKEGSLFGYANFVTSAHHGAAIDNTLSHVEVALRLLKDNWADPESKLEGKMPVEVFRLR